MARHLYRNFYYQTPGALMAGLKTEFAGVNYIWDIDFFFELGEFEVNRALVIVTHMVGDPDEYAWRFVLGGLGSDETAPIRYFTDSPGWSSPWKIAAWGTSGFEADIPRATARMEVVHGAQTSILEEWGRGVLRRTNIDGTDNVVTPTVHTYCKTSVWDVLGEQVVTVDRCIIYDPLGTASVGTEDAAVGWHNVGAGENAGANSPSLLDISGVTQALRDIARRDLTIAHPQSGVVVSSYGSEVEDD